jgi:predicted CxxxxCH...CXXCH cytochrome family protein
MCHGLTAASSTALVANTATHINGTYNVSGTDVKFASFSASWRGSYSSGTKQCSNVVCHSNGKGSFNNPTWGGLALNCNSCHPSLGGAHTRHTGALLASVNFYNYTANKSAGSDPLNTNTWTNYAIGCANCHPVDKLFHGDGIIQVQMNSIVGGSVLRGKSSVASISSIGNNNGTCANVYCHSDGKGNFITTTAWSTSYSTDRCAKCHGNAPATGAHTAHAIGIHADDIFNGRDGKLGFYSSSVRASAHGASSQATTISCNICHYNTTAYARNKSNSQCSSCHTEADTTGMPRITNLMNHVNGAVEVSFAPVNVVSKAQLRPVSFADYTAAGGYWTRSGGGTPNYKNGSAAYDTAKAQLSNTMWSVGNCSNIACHMGKTVNWNAGSLNCEACHSRL